MSVENVAKFYNEVLSAADTREKLYGVSEKTLTKEMFENRVLPEAKSKGYDFTYDDVKEYYKKQGEKTELSVDELENVSGGGGCCTGDDPGVVEQYRQIIDPQARADECDGFLSGNGVKKKYAICNDCAHCKLCGPKHYCEINANC